jgi:hypothetical protein
MENEKKSETQQNNSKQPTGVPVAPQEANAEPSHGVTQNQPKKWYAIFKKPILPQVQWTEVFGALAVVIGGLVCYIYWNQLQVMSRQLGEMQGTTSQTSQLIVNAAHQASGIHDLAVAAGKQADQASIQAEAAKVSADAAKSAAETAKYALHVSERAYISVVSPQLDLSKKVTTLQVINSGQLPSGPGDEVIHEATVDTGQGLSLPQTVVECHWKTTKLGSLVRGTASSIIIPVPNASQTKLEAGLEVVLVSGYVTYSDGFPEDGTQKLSVCVQTTYHAVEKQLIWINCDPASIIPKMEAMDGYPNNEQKN